MTTYTATITSQRFFPKVVVPSVLQITVLSPNGKDIRQIEVTGTIEELRKTFEFKVDGDNFDFTGFTGRKCKVQIDADGFYHFVSMLN